MTTMSSPLENRKRREPQPQPQPPRAEQQRVASAQALSMKFMKSLSGICCKECGNDPIAMTSTDDADDHQQYDENGKSKSKKQSQASSSGTSSTTSPSGLENLRVFQRQTSLLTSMNNSSISPLVMAPMTFSSPSSGDAAGAMHPSPYYRDMNTVEGLLGEYMCLCQFYQVPYNAGIITTLRYSLPSLRVTGSFHDLDMVALCELFLRHANGRLRYIHRLDFTVASKEGRQPNRQVLGFTSHGALALAKALQTTKFVQQVWVQRHRIGPYGASALFLACRDNPTIQHLDLRKCRIGERGAFAFCELILLAPRSTPTPTSTNDNNDSGSTSTSTDGSEATGLIEVDLSSNGIGHRGTSAIERAIVEWNLKAQTPLLVNLEGNLVFPEIMNGVTHGLGVILSMIGGYLLSKRVEDKSWTHTISCSVYTTSLLVLYLSSTLYHSFFTLQHAKYIFQVMDKCAIYVLIAGSYTPFLTVMFGDKPIYSVGLLGFIWMCCFLGIGVEAFYPTWKWRPVFSLSMYLGMGWAAMVCLPETGRRMPVRCIHLIILGGVGYTAGVPFFRRDNNLDHAIWHLFVLSGSIFHWLAVYFYVAPTALACHE